MNKERLPLPPKKRGCCLYSLQPYAGSLRDIYWRHTGFKDVIFVTDRGHESTSNLETYIVKGLPFIACSEVDHGIVLEKITSFGEFNNCPESMEVDPDFQVYYKRFAYDQPVPRSHPPQLRTYVSGFRDQAPRKKRYQTVCESRSPVKMMHL